MATASVTYNFTNGTTADGPQVSQNFTDLLTFLNASVVHKDGTIAMTGALFLAQNGTAALHAVTTQQLADGPPLAKMFGTTIANDTANPTGTYQQWGTEFITIPNPGRKVSLVVSIVGTPVATAGGAVKTCYGHVDYSLDNGGSYTSSQDSKADLLFGSIARGSVSSSVAAQGVTPSNNIKIRGILRQDGGAANEVSFISGYIACIMFPSV